MIFSAIFRKDDAHSQYLQQNAKKALSGHYVYVKRDEDLAIM